MYRYLILITIALLCIFLYKSNKPEHYINLIDNGSFKDGAFSPNNLGTNYGNSVIKLINPGESSYILEQTHVSEGYKLNTTVVPNISYKLSTWVAYKSWDGNKNTFHISFSKKCGKNTINTNPGKIISTKTINNTVWDYRTFIFSIPNNSDGRVEIYIGYKPSATSGLRYYTDIKLEK